VKDPLEAMRGIYQKLGIEGFDEAEGPMRAFLSDRSDHKVSSYQLPKPLAKKVAERLKPFIDRYGYREAVDAALAAPEEDARVPQNATP
jgi:omega-hydroxy-beta-dihydromenaquinone-9 sulfotransferase